MRIIGNLIWLIFGGFFMAIAFYLLGILLCVTIIGIPFGLQAFKVGKFVLWPMGTDIDVLFNEHPIANILWAIFFGWELMLFCFALALFFCITIIGIPFGIQWFKIGLLSLFPFGAELK
ncbi:MAG: YccF domain-containing protein [Bacilli bacterium]|jgi:uncharacterized membrane protein YccF (DUF307 family)|nr:YccF domain-containing protein [Bacilli bacterium]MDY0363919.1 YccF domain-containing protein [Bacilli bacterium]